MSYANDEAFVATILHGNGFLCQNITDLYKDCSFDCFSFSWPTHPNELIHMHNFIVHPVRADGKSRAKLMQLAFGTKDSADRLKTRFSQFISRLNGDEWERFSGISVDYFSDASYVIKPNTLEFFLRCTVRSIDLRFKHRVGLARIVRAWVYDTKVGVLDFELGTAGIAFDLTVLLDEIRPGDTCYSLAVQVFGRNEAGARQLKNLGWKIDNVGKILVESMVVSEGNYRIIDNEIAHVIERTLVAIDLNA